MLMGKEYWKPLLDYAAVSSRRRPSTGSTPSRILVTDSAEEAVQWTRDAALRQFGLTYGPKLKRRWFLWE